MAYENSLDEERMNVFLVDRISSLAERDIIQFGRCFSSPFLIIIPTFNDMTNLHCSKLGFTRIMDIYDPKAMFCKLFLNVLKDESLTAYLPK